MDYIYNYIEESVSINLLKHFESNWFKMMLFIIKERANPVYVLEISFNKPN